MRCLVVVQDDGSEWAIPVDFIARHRATHYAHEFDGDVEKSLAEDTMPLFNEDPFEVEDWASNNMNWSDVSSVAFRTTQEPPPCDYEEGWVNGPKSVMDLKP